MAKECYSGHRTAAFVSTQPNANIDISMI